MNPLGVPSPSSFQIDSIENETKNSNIKKINISINGKTYMVRWNTSHDIKSIKSGPGFQELQSRVNSMVDKYEILKPKDPNKGKIVTIVSNANNEMRAFATYTKDITNGSFVKHKAGERIDFDQTKLDKLEAKLSASGTVDQNKDKILQKKIGVISNFIKNNSGNLSLQSESQNEEKIKKFFGEKYYEHQFTDEEKISEEILKKLDSSKMGDYKIYKDLDGQFTALFKTNNDKGYELLRLDKTDDMQDMHEQIEECLNAFQEEGLLSSVETPPPPILEATRQAAPPVPPRTDWVTNEETALQELGASNVIPLDYDEFRNRIIRDRITGTGEPKLENCRFYEDDSHLFILLKINNLLVKHAVKKENIFIEQERYVRNFVKNKMEQIQADFRATEPFEKIDNIGNSILFQESPV